jgi:hypothetical protein
MQKNIYCKLIPKQYAFAILINNNQFTRSQLFTSGK